MANSNRQSSDPLEKLQPLIKHPQSFNFFAAMRLLDTLFPDQPRTGKSDRPGFESIRIGQTPTLNFAPSSLDNFARSDRGNYWKLRTFLFGMFGPNGPLPIHLTDYAMTRVLHHKDTTFARFADMFHHRMACFFYRAWADSQPCVHLDRTSEDRFATYVGALAGYGSPAMRDRDAMPSTAKQFFSAHLGNFRTYEGGLASILTGFFGHSISIEQFVGHWIRLPDDCQWLLGTSQSVGRLGDNITLGNRVYDYQSRFRIVMGPIDHDRFQALLPYGPSMNRLRAIVDSYVGLELSWDVQLKLCKDKVRPLVLGRYGQLGWTTWLNSRRPAKDADQLVVDPVQKFSRQRELAKRDSLSLSASLPTFGV
jgi:type VI secretion system protein ImpH